MPGQSDPILSSIILYGFGKGFEVHNSVDVNFSSLIPEVSRSHSSWIEGSGTSWSKQLSTSKSLTCTRETTTDCSLT